MLNPSIDKYTIEFSKSFNNNEIAKKYDEYLFYLNGPIKNINDYILESIQVISIPGFNLNTVTVAGLNNLKGSTLNIGSKPSNFTHTTTNKTFAGTSSQIEILENQIINVTFRNTLLNWMYIYELSQNYYSRNRTVSDFSIIITLHDAADIPLMQFIFKDSFISAMPGLEFAFNQQFREAKTIDASFTFNGMDTKFIIPEFNLSKIKL